MRHITLLFLLVSSLSSAQTKVIGKGTIYVIDGPVGNIPAVDLERYGDNALYWDVSNKVLTSADTSTVSGLVQIQIGDANGGTAQLGESGITTIRPGITYANSTTTFTAVPNYTFSGEAGETYHFELQFAIAGSSTSDSKWRAQGGDGYFSVTNAENSVTKVKNIGSSTANVALSNSSETTGDKIVIVGVVEFTANGSFSIECGLNSGTDTLTIYDGFIRYEKL